MMQENGQSFHSSRSSSEPSRRSFRLPVSTWSLPTSQSFISTFSGSFSQREFLLFWFFCWFRDFLCHFSVCRTFCILRWFPCALCCIFRTKNLKPNCLSMHFPAHSVLLSNYRFSPELSLFFVRPTSGFFLRFRCCRFDSHILCRSIC